MLYAVVLCVVVVVVLCVVVHGLFLCGVCGVPPPHLQGVPCCPLSSEVFLCGVCGGGGGEVLALDLYLALGQPCQNPAT